jgi:hypothetical protein
MQSPKHDTSRIPVRHGDCILSPYQVEPTHSGLMQSLFAETKMETMCICWLQLSRFHLKTET